MLSATKGSASRNPSPMAVLGRTDQATIDRGERDIRVDDFLEDKLQTNLDFESLDDLLASVEAQRVQLQEQVKEPSVNLDEMLIKSITNSSIQLQDAASALEKAKVEAESHAGLILQNTADFNAQQGKINKRLLIVTTSDAPDEAIQNFIGPMEKLRRVGIAKSYVELLKEVDTLTAEARYHLPNNPKAALKPYSLLKLLAVRLSDLQGPAEGAGVHVVTYVEQRVNSLWKEMQKIMTDEFEAVLKKIKWPSSEGQEVNKEWSESFQKLLDLQTPELVSTTGPVVLLPMAVMAKSFEQRFRYHFMGARPTSSTFTVRYPTCFRCSVMY